MTKQPRRLYRLWIALAGCSLLLARPPGTAWACSCAQPGAPADAFLQADAVFVGTATRIVNRLPPPWVAWLLQRLPGYQPQYDDVRVSFRVTGAWKGVAARDLSVRTGQGQGDCGFAFTAGGQYLVYAARSSGELHTSICTRTNEVTLATADLAYLQTLTPLALPAPTAASFPWAVAAFAALGLAALAVLAWAAARSKARRPSA